MHISTDQVYNHKRASVEDNIKISNYYGASKYLGEIFNWYILEDNYQLCERLLCNFNVDIDNLFYKGNTLLMMASSSGSLDLVLLFLVLPIYVRTLLYVSVLLGNDFDAFGEFCS